MALLNRTSFASAQLSVNAAACGWRKILKPCLQPLNHSGACRKGAPVDDNPANGGFNHVASNGGYVNETL